MKKRSQRSSEAAFKPTSAGVGSVRPARRGLGGVEGWALILILGVLYVPHFWQSEFIWDDDAHITENSAVLEPAGIFAIWTTPAARICPLTLSHFWLQHLLWGLRPFPFHLMTLGMHVAGAWVLWRVLRDHLLIPGAWLAAALWAVHPVQVETVAWVTELKNTQSGFFFFLCVLFYLRAREQDFSGKELFLCFASGWAAVASKSSTVVLPGVLLLLEFHLSGGLGWKKVLRLWPLFVASLASAVLSIWTQSLEGAQGVGYERGVFERVLDAAKVFWFYLGKLVWPWPLTFIYPRWQTVVSSWVHWVPLLAYLGAFFGLSFLAFRRGLAWAKGVWAGWMFFSLVLSPVLTLLDHYFLRYTLVGDHFQYLASAGPLALFAMGIARWVKGRLYPAFIGLTLLPLGWICWDECKEYKDSATLWKETLADNPGAWMAHNNYGLLLQRSGDLEEALAHHEKAVELEPKLANEPRHDLGFLMLKLGRVEEAIVQHDLGLAIKPSMEGETNLAAALLAAGRKTDAIVHFEKAVALSPKNAQAKIRLGYALNQAQRFEEAMRAFDEAALLAPQQAEIPFERGNAYFLMKEKEKAILSFQEAIRLNPRHAKSHVNLGALFLEARDDQKAKHHFELALRFGERSLDALNNLAWVLAGSRDDSLRDGEKALTLAEEALKITDGLDLRVWRLLAACHAELGHYERAVQALEKAVQRARPDARQQDLLEKEMTQYRAHQPWRAEP